MSVSSSSVSEDQPSSVNTGETEGRGLIYTTVPQAPELNKEVKWDENDRTSTRITWEGTTTAQQERYIITWWANESDKQEAESNGREYVLTELKEGSVYFVRMIQINSEGQESNPSNIIRFETGPKKPCNIQVLNYDPSPHNSLLVKFEDSNQKRVKHEVVLQPVSGGDKISVPVEKGINFVLVKDLVPGESYSVNVLAVNGELRSDQTNHPALVQTYPDTTPNINKEVAPNGLKIHWDHLKIRPKKYKIYWEANGERKNDETVENEYFLRNLEPSSIYKFRVSACNGAGEGEKSKELEHVTAPSAPVNVQVSNNPKAKERSFIVKYEDPKPMAKKSYRTVATGLDGKVVSEVESEDYNVVLRDLEPGQSYYIHVVAIYQGLESPLAHYLKKQ